MAKVIFQARFKLDDLKKVGPTALMATEMALSIWEKISMQQYADWKRSQIVHYTEEYDKNRQAFEDRDCINQFYFFRIDYIQALEDAETKQEMFMIYLEFQRFFMGLLLEKNNVC